MDRLAPHFAAILLLAEFDDRWARCEAEPRARILATAIYELETGKSDARPIIRTMIVDRCPPLLEQIKQEVLDDVALQDGSKLTLPWLVEQRAPLFEKIERTMHAPQAAEVLDMVQAVGQLIKAGTATRDPLWKIAALLIGFICWRVVRQRGPVPGSEEEHAERASP